MSDEKRLYKRINIGAKGLVYDGNEEYEGTVKDISENGVGLIVSAEDGAKIEKSENMDVIVMDEDEVHVINTRIVRAEKNGENSVIIGGRIKNQKDIVDYVRSKEVEEYLGTLN